VPSWVSRQSCSTFVLSAAPPSHGVGSGPSLGHCAGDALILFSLTAARFAARRRCCLYLPRPSRSCHPSDRGRRVRARAATAQRLGLDSADLLDLDAGTLAIEITRVVVDGQVIESDGKTENAQHVLALDPFTLAVLKAHVEQLDQERRELGPDYQGHGVLFCWEDGRPPHPDRSRGGSRSWPPRRACRRSTCTTSGIATPHWAAMRGSTGRR